MSVVRSPIRSVVRSPVYAVTNPGGVGGGIVTLVSDTFTRANSSSIGNTETGQAWTEGGDGAGMIIVSNRVANESTSTARGGWAYCESGEVDIIIQATIRFTIAAATSRMGGLLIRRTDNDTFWIVRCRKDTSVFEIVQFNNPTYTVRASTAKTFVHATDYIVRADVVGTTITATCDGGVETEYALASEGETKTEHGMFTYANLQESLIDDFTITTRG